MDKEKTEGYLLQKGGEKSIRLVKEMMDNGKKYAVTQRGKKWFVYEFCVAKHTADLIARQKDGIIYGITQYYEKVCESYHYPSYAKQYKDKK